MLLILRGKKKRLNLAKTLDRIVSVNHSLKIETCKLFESEMNYFFQVISSSGNQPQPEKVVTLKGFPIPRVLKEFQSFLRLTNYYGKNIHSFPHVVKHQDLTRGDGVKKKKKITCVFQEGCLQF